MLQKTAAYDLLPDSHITWDHRASGLRKIVDDWIGNGTAKATVQTTYGPIEEWDMSNVTNMDSLFFNKPTFNGDISKWNTSRVTNMNQVFGDAVAFNCDLSHWVVSSVTSMQNMFKNVNLFFNKYPTTVQTMCQKSSTNV